MKTEIEVRFFDGDEESAFLFAVQANITHGLPLTMADRTAAATRILAFRSDWSDRAVARITGLSAATVGAIRRRANPGPQQPGSRVGRDGKRHRMSTAEGRVHASELIAKKPDASLREIAEEAGISPSTVRDVRRRIAQGGHPVPAAQRRTVTAAPSSLKSRERAKVRPPDVVFERLKRDPAIRSNENGRSLLNWLAPHVRDVDKGSSLIEHLPSHGVIMTLEAARALAHSWNNLAREFEQRLRT